MEVLVILALLCGLCTHGILSMKPGEFRGMFKGTCSGDGLYYNNENSFVMCAGDNYYVQPCPSGTKNRPFTGSDYNFNNFCDIHYEDKSGSSRNAYSDERVPYDAVKPVERERKYDSSSKHDKNDGYEREIGYEDRHRRPSYPRPVPMFKRPPVPPRVNYRPPERENSYEPPSPPYNPTKDSYRPQRNTYDAIQNSRKPTDRYSSSEDKYKPSRYDAPKPPQYKPDKKEEYSPYKPRNNVKPPHNPTESNNYNPPPPPYRPPSKHSFTEYHPEKNRSPKNEYKPKTSYTPPLNQYTPPRSGYTPSREKYVSPQLYTPPVNQYEPPKSAYKPPAREYEPPKSAYKPPAREYEPPKPAYKPPPSQYEPPKPSYEAPPMNQYEPHKSEYKPQYEPPKADYKPSLDQYEPPKSSYEKHRDPPKNQYQQQNQAYPPMDQYPPQKPDYKPTANQYPPVKNDYAPPTEDYKPSQNGYPPPEMYDQHRNTPSYTPHTAGSYRPPFNVYDDQQTHNLGSYNQPGDIPYGDEPPRDSGKNNYIHKSPPSFSEYKPHVELPDKYAQQQPKDNYIRKETNKPLLNTYSKNEESIYSLHKGADKLEKYEDESDPDGILYMVITMPKSEDEKEAQYTNTKEEYSSKATKYIHKKDPYLAKEPRVLSPYHSVKDQYHGSVPPKPNVERNKLKNTGTYYANQRL